MGNAASAAFGSRSTADEVLEGHDLGNKVFVITGANTGIGKETARALAAKGAQLVLGCRDETKAAVAAAEIRGSTGNGNVRTFPLDTSDLASVAAFAGALEAAGVTKIDGLLNSAPPSRGLGIKRSLIRSFQAHSA